MECWNFVTADFFGLRGLIELSTCTCMCGLESNKTSSYFLTTMSGWFPGLQGFSRASALWIQVLLSLIFSHFVPRVDFLISMAFLMAYFHLFFRKFLSRCGSQTCNIPAPFAQKLFPNKAENLQHG